MDAVRLCRWQKLQVILVVDDVHYLTEEADLRDLDRLIRLEPYPGSQVTVILAGRDTDENRTCPNDWRLNIRLPALLRSETEHFIVTKLAAAGRSEPTFTPRALDRVHDLTQGVPRGIDRVAALALMASAARGLEVVTPEVVLAVASECEHDDPLAA